MRTCNPGMSSSKLMVEIKSSQKKKLHLYALLHEAFAA